MFQLVKRKTYLPAIIYIRKLPKFISKNKYCPIWIRKYF